MLGRALQFVDAAWSELGRVFWELFLLPATYCLRVLLEIAPERAAGLASLEPDAWSLRLFSAAAWLVAIWLVARLWILIRKVDRALTYWVIGCRDAAVSRLRVAQRLLIYKLQRIWLRPQEPPWAIARTIELADIELAVLRAHLLLVPGEAATPRDLAAAHALSASRARQMLRRFAKLGLVEVDRVSQAEGYRLTPYGRLFLGSVGTERLEASDVESEREPHRARFRPVHR